MNNFDDYYIFTAGEQKGPYAIQQLSNMWQSGTITTDSLYWQAGFDEWRPISELKESLQPRPSVKAPYYPAYAPSLDVEKPIGFVEMLWILFVCFGLAVVGFLFGLYYVTTPDKKLRGAWMLGLSVLGFFFWAIIYRTAF